MVRLTEEMVVARTRISDLTAVKRLNCWGTELTDIGILRNLKNVEVLSLSVNNIDTLADFQYCLNLQDLFVRKNNIKDLREICYLQGLPNLRNLWLDENPCAEQDGYRLTVLRALPNLDKLDDKVVTTEEIQNAQVSGRTLFHPLNMDASPTHSETSSPEEAVADDYIDESELVDQRRRYGSSVDQHQQQATGFTGHTGRAERRTIREYQENDRRNANWSTSPTFQQHNYQQNSSYGYEILQNGQIRNDRTETEVMNPAESRGILDNFSPTTATSATTIATNSLGILKTGESERSRRRRRHSSGNAGEDPTEQDHRRLYPYSDNGENDSINQRSGLDRQIETNAAVSPRTSYPPIDYSDERRSAAERRECGIFNHEEEQQQDRRQLSESDQQQPKRSSAASYHHHHHNNSIVDRDEAVSREREMAASQGGWVRHSEKEKCRFHYHRRPVTRNSNILSAVLCLVKELDYPSLEVVEMAVRNRMDELEE